MKRYRIITFFVIFLLTISAIVLMLSNSHEKEETNYLYPTNFMELHFAYEGNVYLTNVYAELYNIFEEDIPHINTQLSKLKKDEKIEKYYQNNSYVNSIIQDLENFKIIVDELKENNVKKLKLESSEIIENSCEVKNNNTQFLISVKYENCDKMLFKIVILNEQENNSYIKIFPVVVNVN